MNGDTEAPCDHWDRLAGTVAAGDVHDKASPFLSVATCAQCIGKSKGYVEHMTGLRANPFLSYEQARAERAS